MLEKKIIFSYLKAVSHKITNDHLHGTLKHRNEIYISFFSFFVFCMSEKCYNLHWFIWKHPSGDSEHEWITNAEFAD